MSQQINLINLDLRPRRDWLRFRIVAPAALACLLAVTAAALLERAEQRSLTAREAAVAGELKAAQERLQTLTRTLAERTADPALAAEAERLAAAVQVRQEALQVIEGGDQGRGTAFVEALRGFSRQTMDGVWLTGFAVAGQDMEIRGRMLDSSLLPNYIRRLNAEAAFRGRRFDALDMQGVVPPPPDKNDAAAPARRLPRYTEFALRAGMAADKPKSGGAQ